MKRRTLGRLILSCTLAFCAVWVFWDGTAYAELQITYPTSNSTVPGRVVALKGTGADPNSSLEVIVVTSEEFLQTGTPRINQDGSWTYAPCHLAGQGEYNNHTIFVTIIRAGIRGESTSISGVVRRSK